MSEKAPRPRLGRVQKVVEVISTGGYSLLHPPEKISKHQRTWYSDVLTEEQSRDFERRNQSHTLLGTLAVNDPQLGMQIFNSLRVSEEPGLRHYAAGMVTSLFTSDELADNEAVIDLWDDPDKDVRAAIDIVMGTMRFGTNLDFHRRQG